MACRKPRTFQVKMYGSNHAFLLNAFFLLLALYYLPAAAQPDTTLKKAVKKRLQKTLS